jgi:hypothetical protein
VKDIVLTTCDRCDFRLDVIMMGGGRGGEVKEFNQLGFDILRRDDVDVSKQT